MELMKNKKRKKSAIALFLAGTMLFQYQIGISYAAETATLTDQSTVSTVVEPETLTLADALEIALANNLDLKYAEADKERTMIYTSQQSKIAKEDDPTGIYSMDLLVDIAKVNKKYLPQIADKTYETIKKSIELSVKNTYVSLVYAKENYDLEKKYKDQVDESYKLTQKKFALGQASNIDVINAQAEMAVKEAELVQAEITYHKKIMDMNQILNQSLDKDWKLDSSINSINVTLPSLGTLETHMLANHPSILRANLNFSLAEATFNLAKGFYPPNVWTYRYAEQDYYKAKYQHNETLLAQEKSLYQAYISVEGSTEAINMYKKSLEVISESYRISKIQYDLGMIVNHDLNEALLAQQRMESTLLNAKFNYQLAIAQLEFISGYDIKQ